MEGLQCSTLCVALNARKKFKSVVWAVIAHRRFMRGSGKNRQFNRGTFEERHRTFLLAYPDYADHEAALLEMRAREFGRLDANGHVYMDHTGGSLYPISIVNEHAQLLCDSILGNPHSTNPTSLKATHFVEDARQDILNYVNADPREYTVVFTLNATGALKLVAEAFPFSAGSQLLLSADNHNSVGGIREHAIRKGGRVYYAPLNPCDLRMVESKLDTLLHTPMVPGTHNLFAFPGQSNFSGAKHPLSLVAEAKALGWTVLLDTAAFLPTNELDLSIVKPDFCTVSFYKIFGYPSGIGALIARKEALELLRAHRPSFCGGVVTVATMDPPRYVLAPHEAAFEDGTVAYTQIPAVVLGLRFMRAVGVSVVQQRVDALTAYLLKELAALRHRNGAALVTVLGPKTVEHRGGTVSIAMWDVDGKWILPGVVEQRANALKISLRVGCFCNPGAGQTAFGFDETNPYLQKAYDHFGLKGHGSDYSRGPDGALTLRAAHKPSSWSRWSSLWSCVDASSVRAQEYAAPNDTQCPAQGCRCPGADLSCSATPLSKPEFLDYVMDFTRGPLEAIRVSVGLTSTFADVDTLLALLHEYVDYKRA